MMVARERRELVIRSVGPLVVRKEDKLVANGMPDEPLQLNGEIAIVHVPVIG